ncbi:Spy/CpxP family protein refolding chaperone [Chryseobacterium gambrini]|uniref:Spy/CpxP family protein refolding chaperone n=1 Tax=Chryseobacterium gambrini TaxID=373672 RepID=UPI003BA62A62
MTKNRFYIFIIVGLLISNLLLVIFMLTRKPPHHSGPRNLIIERLHLDEKQIQQYDVLIRQHRMQIREKEHEMMDAKTQYYSLLKNKDQKNGDSLVQQIGKISMETEKINFKHFQDIRKICRPDQLQDFDHLIDEFESLFALVPKPPHER